MSLEQRVRFVGSAGLAGADRRSKARSSQSDWRAVSGANVVELIPVDGSDGEKKKDVLQPFGACGPCEESRLEFQPARQNKAVRSSPEPARDKGGNLRLHSAVQQPLSIHSTSFAIRTLLNYRHPSHLVPSLDAIGLHISRKPKHRRTVGSQSNNQEERKKVAYIHNVGVGSDAHCAHCR